MFKEKLQELGATKINSLDGENTHNSTTVEMELRTKLPNILKAILEHVGGSIVFNNGAKIIPNMPTHYTEPNGFQPIEQLYGLDDGEHGLIHNNNMYSQQISSNYYTIGECSGGDQLCINRLDGKVYCWNHESPESEDGMSEVSVSFSDFFNNLEPDIDLSENAKQIDTSNSFLDF